MIGIFRSLAFVLVVVIGLLHFSSRVYFYVYIAALRLDFTWVFVFWLWYPRSV